MDSREIEEFLTHLAVNERVSASTQNQALSALLFLYRILDMMFGTHQLMAKLLYGCGLRLIECMRLRVKG